jgi:hypothetical protein
VDENEKGDISLRNEGVPVRVGLCELMGVNHEGIHDVEELEEYICGGDDRGGKVIRESVQGLSCDGSK